MFGQEHIKPIIDHNFRFYGQTLYLILRKIQKSYHCIACIVYIYVMCSSPDFGFLFFVLSSFFYRTFMNDRRNNLSLRLFDFTVVLSMIQMM